MARTGRPKKNINWTEFERLCRIQCSLKEMCEWFGVSDKTLYRGCKEHYGETFSAVFAKKRIGGLISLRHNMFKQSEKSAAVAIFLSKNLLGMSDKQETILKGDEKQPVVIKGVDMETKKLLGEVLSGKGTDGTTDNADIQ